MLSSSPPAPRRYRRLSVVAAVAVACGLTAHTVGPAAAERGRTTGASAAASTDRSTAAEGLQREAVELQQRAIEARIAHHAAKERVHALEMQHDRLVRQAEAASREAGRRYDELADQAGGVMGSLATLVTGDDSPADRAEAAADAAREAADLVALAKEALDTARSAADTAEEAWTASEVAAEATKTAVSARVAAETAVQQARFRRDYRAGDRAQDRRNQKALQNWTAYLMSLADAGVVPPDAADLADPRRLPRKLDPVRDHKGRPVPGVATADPKASSRVVVLPAETIRAVSAAFRRIGLPGDQGPDPAAYACGGLTREVWASAALPIPADSVTQWETLTTVRDGQLQTGDLVFLGDDDLGVRSSGVHLGGRMMIAADPADGEVLVTRTPKGQPYGARRVSLSSAEDLSVPLTNGASGCGVTTEPPATDGDTLWTHPLGDAPHRTSASFGASGAFWSSGQHSGQDFAAPIGTPVYASRPGVVTVERPGWAGNLVRLDHGGGVETWYAHLAQVSVVDGESVAAGAVVGAVGSEGNSTGPHLHFEVRLDGVAIDPMVVIGPAEPATGWGGFANGEIPASALCSATPGGQLLRCDAAIAYRLLDASFAEAMGTGLLCITDSYRSREGQERLFVTKPGLAAVPGTSNHGLGLAVDLCGGVERFGTPEHLWMVANGPALGWHHPDWAGADGSRPEPWHFEFGPVR